MLVVYTFRPSSSVAPSLFTLRCSGCPFFSGQIHVACTDCPIERVTVLLLDLAVRTDVAERRDWIGLRMIEHLSLVPKMQTVNRQLTIKQYQPAIQPISVTPAATIQPIATVVTGSNVKDDYESA